MACDQRLEPLLAKDNRVLSQQNLECGIALMICTKCRTAHQVFFYFLGVRHHNSLVFLKQGVRLINETRVLSLVVCTGQAWSSQGPQQRPTATLACVASQGVANTFVLADPQFSSCSLCTGHTKPACTPAAHWGPPGRGKEGFARRKWRGEIKRRIGRTTLAGMILQGVH